MGRPAQTPYNRFPAPELLHVLMLPDFERADRIGEVWGIPVTRTFAELLIDCEEDRRCGRSCSGCSGRWSVEDRTLRAVLVGMLREGEG